MNRKYNYAKLMTMRPTSYGTMTNSIGQEIEFFEHPELGDLSMVICVNHKERLAVDSDFYETGDMDVQGGDYEPIFAEGEFKHGNF